MKTLESMLSRQQKFNLQSNTNLIKLDQISFKSFMMKLRNFLNNPSNLPEAFHAPETSRAEKVVMQDRAVEIFISKERPVVQDYVDSVGNMDFVKLIRDAKNYITGGGIIQTALDDPDVEEIQINDKNSIFVIKKGHMIPYVDENGKPFMFDSDQDVIDLVNRLVDDGTANTRNLAENAPLFNAKTFKHQYRISVTHSSAVARMLPPYDFGATTVTIRKFNTDGYSIDDLVKFGTLTQDMADLSMLIARTRMNRFYVGQTGSGKTTLMRIHTKCVPMSWRILLIQNPTEITFSERDEYGRFIRNVVHWEASESADVSVPTSNTMGNLLNHQLRNTPDFTILGEARSPEEFQYLNTQAQTGQLFSATFHAEGAEGAFRRILEATKANPVDVANYFNVVFWQDKLSNHARKVMSITEIYVEDEKIIFNDLYKYFEETPTETEKGVVLQGHFEKVGTPSKHMLSMFNKAGILPAEYQKFL